MFLKSKPCFSMGGVNELKINSNPSVKFSKKRFLYKTTTISLVLASLFAFSSSLVFAQPYEYEHKVNGVVQYKVVIQDGKSQVFFQGAQPKREDFNNKKIQTGENADQTLLLKDFDEIVINTSSKGAFPDDWTAHHINLPDSSKLTINLTGNLDGTNALRVIGWQDSFKAGEVVINTDAINAAALRSDFRDKLKIDIRKLIITTTGDKDVYGIKIAPGRRSGTTGSGQGYRPRADRELTFGQTFITMKNGGVGAYIGSDGNEVNPNDTDAKDFYLITADLGNTTIIFEGNPNPEGKNSHNVGLFSSGFGLIKTSDYTFSTSSEKVEAIALKASVNDDGTFYPETGWVKNPTLEDDDHTGFDDSNPIDKTADIRINGNVNIKVASNSDYKNPTSLAADAGKDGRIVINEKADNQFSIQIDGDIRANDQGASIVVNANSSNSLLTSNVNFDNGGQVTLGLGNSARWNVRGNSHVTQLNALEGNAYVDLTHESQTRNTLVIDDLQGSAQLTFVLHSDIKGKDAVGANDKVIIKSAGSEAQIHTLHIPSTGEPEGDETRGSYLVYVPQNVSVVLNETHHPDKNVSHRVVDKGLYLYTLASEKDVGTPDEIKTNLRAEDKYDAYYLTLAGFTPDNQQGGDDNKPVTPLLSPTAKAVLAMAGMGGQNAMYHNQLSDLRKRLGEVRGMTESNGLWVSASGQRDRFDGFASNGVKQNAYRFNLGLDHKIGSWLVGANFKYLHGTQKTSNLDSHAKGKVNSAGANIYGTWIAENGFYTDIVASFDHYHQKITTSMLDGRGVSGKVNNFGLGLSAEVGKKFGLTKDFFVEPQAQLAYYWIKGKDFSMSNGMKVEQDNFNSLVGRLGVVVGKDFKDAEGNTKGQVFVKGGVKQQFAGKQKLRANSVQFKDELKGTSGYYGLGFEANPNKKVSLYGHVERENGKHYTKEIEVMLGLRYKF